MSKKQTKPLLERTKKLEPTPENTQITSWDTKCPECGKPYKKAWARDLRSTAKSPNRCGMCGSPISGKLKSIYSNRHKGTNRIPDW